MSVERVARIEALLRQAAELWIDEYGDEGYIAGETSSLVSFLGGAEHAYFPAHKERFPINWLTPRERELAHLISHWEFPPDGAPIVYMHFNKEECLYIGKTTCFTSRMRAHRRHSSWWSDITEIEMIPCLNKDALANEEKRLIKRLRPTFNVIHNGEPR